MATLPVKSAQIQVTVGGPGGVIQYNPPFVVGCPYYVLSSPLDDRSQLECQRWRCRHLRLPAEESHSNTVFLR